MLTLTHDFSDSVNGIPVNLAFDNVLKAFEALDNKELPQPNRIYEALTAFGVKGTYTLAERAFLLEKTLELVNEYSESIDRYNYKNSGSAGKAIDYKKDTGLLYAAFMQAYGMDLYEQRGKLHWVKFVTLLNNMPDDTRLSKVMGYRVSKIPPATKYNRQEVMRLKELRDIYRLEERPDAVQDRINNTLAGIFGAFGARR